MLTHADTCWHLLSPTHVCSPRPYHTQPWCDATLGIDARVADAVSRMTLAEKIPNLDSGAPGIPSLGLNGYNWWSEASTGVASGAL